MITKSVRVYGEFRSTTSLQLNCLAQKYTTTDISCIVFAQSHKDILKSKTPHPPVRRRLLVNSLGHIDPIGSFICTKSRSFTFASKKSLFYTEFHWQRKQMKLAGQSSSTLPNSPRDRNGNGSERRKRARLETRVLETIVSVSCGV